MGTKNQSEEKKEQARTYWRAGRSQRWIAEELNVSPSSINNWVKGIEQDLNELVNTKTSVLEKESQLSVQEKFAVQEIVDERTKDLIFIRKASLIVAQKAVQKVQQEDCSMQDLRHAQEVIGKGKENIYGKQPDTAIQINNGQPQQSVSTDQYLAARNRLIESV